MAIRDSSGLIHQERDSMVNMGENMAKDNMRELRKMKKEIVDPRLGSNHLEVEDLLPKVALLPSKQEETKHAKERYAAFDDSEEINMGSGILPESQLQSARQKA